MHSMRDMPEGPPFLTTVQASERIGIDRSTLSRWIKFGEAHPVMQLGDAKNSGYLFTADEVARLKADHESRLEAAS